LELGFTQIATHNDKLYYKKGELEVMLIKSNHVDTALVETICEHIDVPYEFFVDLYRQSYIRSLR
jgi:hypothetical protein